MKVGILRCMQTEDYCPGTTDFAAIRKKLGAFADVQGEVELVGFVSCGGCPGKKALLRAQELVRRGADTIALASCIGRGRRWASRAPSPRRWRRCCVRDWGIR